MRGPEAQVLSSCGLAQSLDFPVLADKFRRVVHPLQRQTLLTDVSVYSLFFFYWEGASQLLGEKIKQDTVERGIAHLRTPAGLVSWCGAGGPGPVGGGGARLLAQLLAAETLSSAGTGRKGQGGSVCALRTHPTPPPRPPPDISSINEVKHLNHFLFYSVFI